MSIIVQVMLTEADSKLWPNTRAAIAKASLTAYRYTCGSTDVDVDRAKLLLRHSEFISMEPGTVASEHRVHFTGRNPIVCWRESANDTSRDVDIEICVSPVLVCKRVVQTVGGGDNISAAALVLHI